MQFIKQLYKFDLFLWKVELVLLTGDNASEAIDKCLQKLISFLFNLQNHFFD